MGSRCEVEGFLPYGAAWRQMLVFTFHFSPRIEGWVTLEPFLGLMDTKKIMFLLRMEPVSIVAQLIIIPQVTCLTRNIAAFCHHTVWHLGHLDTVALSGAMPYFRGAMETVKWATKISLLK
jgi:hypothetical protein